MTTHRVATQLVVDVEQALTVRRAAAAAAAEEEEAGLPPTRLRLRLRIPPATASSAGPSKRRVAIGAVFVNASQRNIRDVRDGTVLSSTTESRSDDVRSIDRINDANSLPLSCRCPQFAQQEKMRIDQHLWSTTECVMAGSKGVLCA
jgi:hypothetical protein